jgi:hypothetical protein
VTVIARLLVVTTLVVSPFGAACSGVRHATRGAEGLPARDVELVEVRTTGLDGAWRVINFASWDVALNEPLPTEAPEDVIISMREAASSHGARVLFVERWEDTYRQAFFGYGVEPVEGASFEGLAPVPPCAHASFKAALSEVSASARACVRDVRGRRPGLRGVVDALFEVDPFGGTLRAAASPDSSRDSELQACVIARIYATGWGAPEALTCRGAVRVDLTDFD